MGPQGLRGYNGSAGPQGPQGEDGPEAVNGLIDLNDYCRPTQWECDLAVGESSCNTEDTVAPVSMHALGSGRVGRGGDRSV